jgi:hypothetical protein
MLITKNKEKSHRFYTGWVVVWILMLIETNFFGPIFYLFKRKRLVHFG